MDGVEEKCMSGGQNKRKRNAAGHALSESVTSSLVCTVPSCSRALPLLRVQPENGNND
jgi:hypothetical protein